MGQFLIYEHLNVIKNYLLSKYIATKIPLYYCKNMFTQWLFYFLMWATFTKSQIEGKSYHLRDNFWNMEWSNTSLGDSFCDLECMTSDCNFDTAPENIGPTDTPIDFFEQYSDCE